MTDVQQRADAGVLAVLLDGEYAALRARAREFLVEHAAFHVEAESLDRDAYRDRVRDLVVEAAARGLTASGFPAAYGGSEDFGGNVAAFETLAYGDLSVLVKFGVQFGLFGGAIHQLGTTRHHDAWLADIASARLLGSFAMTETGHGSNVQAIRTTATFDPDTDEFVIDTPDDDARKDYIGNAARHAEAAAVFAQLVVDGTGHGVHALFVPLRDPSGATLPGVRIEDCGTKLGLQGVDNGRIWFDGVRVPRTNLLNRYGDVSPEGVYSSPIENPDRRFFTMLGTLVQGRVCVGGAGITASKVALTIATRYAAERRQFGAAGQPETVLLDYGQHQRRLLPLVARTYALHFAQERLARDFHEVFTAGDATTERRRRALESRAAATKSLATWHATRTIQECREACGGAGYLAVNRFAALKADTDVFTTFEGDNTILLQLVGKGRLTDLKDEFGSLDGVAMARYIGREAAETLAEKVIARSVIERVRDAARGHDEGEPGGDLLDPAYQLRMLRTREERITGSVARRLKAGMDAGVDPAEVFSRCQHHLLAAAAAHAERIVLEALLTKVEAMPTGPERDLLAKVGHLHALSEIERDRAWWMEHGRLSTERAKSVTRAVDTLCRELRDDALTLVAAFGVPEPLLTQEI
ncbi:acyl-CoA dehydrogenase family protein [Nocardioides jiangxiensis]|uniref:Acyl-CoA dehydrogenase family protein n=1 Tax=Nocardioides jiangxiensis TaxID=3064524 RepID=A0ABT9B071_9ACTN|nr:acyl-CoA dehydrogenase family protein [Nocardioides sp. WY-20]MDO7868236.1 acyl-CoA dehydrogenase family protein [Nocardioides sp. WY-20]